MSALPKCLLLVTVEVDDSVEEAWNLWYDRVHLPAALACPGVLTGRRYASVDGTVSETDHGARSKIDARIYTTVYELAGPEAIGTPEFEAMRGWYQFGAHVRSSTQVVMALD